MGRRKEFSREEVLEKAMCLFWRKGYEGTSVQDLVAETGINRASMYGTYGDKRQLFAEAFDRYLARNSSKRLLKLDERTSGKEAIRCFFEDLLVFSTGRGRKLGCLLTNSAVELAPHDSDIEERLRAGMGRVEDALYRTLLRAQRDGEIDPERDVRSLSRFYLGVIQGIRVLSRSNPDESLLRDIVKEALARID